MIKIKQMKFDKEAQNTPAGKDMINAQRQNAEVIGRQ